MPASSVYILCIESANTVISVAIAKNGECLALNEVVEPNKAADKLHVLVKEVLASTQLNFSDLSAIAISSGPGSYTGLRIAAAAAKGYGFAMNIPVIAIPTFESMIYGIQHRYLQFNFDVYVPMIDARRMEVFSSFYNGKGEIVQNFKNIIIDEGFNSLFIPENKYLLFGSGSSKSATFIKSDTIYVFNDFIPCAIDLCLLSHLKFDNQLFEDIAYFEPMYTKGVHTTKPAGKNIPTTD